MSDPQYITDSKGKKLSVVLPVKEYARMLEEMEELADIRLYDNATKKMNHLSRLKQLLK